MAPLTTLPSKQTASSFLPIPSSIASLQISAEEIALPPSPQYEPSDPPSSPPPASSPTVGHEMHSSRGEPFPTTTPSRPRAQSPPRKMRPLSTGGITSLPPMQRAHSSPGVDSSGRYITPYATGRRPSSPLYSGRRHSPLRSAMEEPYPNYTMSSWSGLNIEPNIPENAELELSGDVEAPHQSPSASYSHTFPRSRRRFPLHQSASAPSLHARAVSPSMSGRTSPSPSFTSQKYTYEAYPAYSVSSTSSMPSTPTSLRSRSPSISSLETIEDTPDAEEAALLQEGEEAKMKGEDGDLGELRRKASLDSRASNLRSNKERKRWSVCGAERRADFSLEPIEE
ncbi:hypothetical protein A1O1_06819 [Capronia coronata CBS 617.96]|uniref:Uncharacterized protein n=1 Tax=Capronia coronata CBS 617.96 TaxID=1182541 RepID=W9Y0N4_9EURO|nr:uncharacterized protein A1O1_06819 [Capronia coronata CBS 617.96]EXJ83200.1 hypothetical protein A1O1_06819 [Capronia coronata CBS 617.96]